MKLTNYFNTVLAANVSYAPAKEPTSPPVLL